MSSCLSHVTIDCRNALELSEWKAGARYVDIEADPNLPGHVECMIGDPELGQQLQFIEGPDDELHAKRIHLDVAPRVRPRRSPAELMSRDDVSRWPRRDGFAQPGCGGDERGRCRFR